jgi:hypothetical protein
MMATMMLASRALTEKRRIYAHGLGTSRLELRRFGVSATEIPLIDLRRAHVISHEPHNSPPSL